MLIKRGSYLLCVSFLIRLNKPAEKFVFKTVSRAITTFLKNKRCPWGTQFLSSTCINFEQTAFHMHFFIYSRMMHIIYGLQQKSELISGRMEAASVIALFKRFTWIYLKFQLHSFNSCFVFAHGTIEATTFPHYSTVSKCKKIVLIFLWKNTSRKLARLFKGHLFRYQPLTLAVSHWQIGLVDLPAIILFYFCIKVNSACIWFSNQWELFLLLPTYRKHHKKKQVLYRQNSQTPKLMVCFAFFSCFLF